MDVANKTVAVITSTIGRSSLERAILSVKNQTYPCTHYVFVDGKQFFEQARQILDKYPDVIATYLPMNTGANGWSNSSINAIAPFLVKEDILCYLDDDNWYESNHIENSVNTLIEKQVDYVYSLRNLYNSQNNTFLCQDWAESVGHHSLEPLQLRLDIDFLDLAGMLNVNNNQHIDTNCYVLTKKVAIDASKYWYSGSRNDNNVSQWLSKSEYKAVCTQAFTVNYLIELDKYMSPVIRIIKEKADEKNISMDVDVLNSLIEKIAIQLNSAAKQQYETKSGKYPWE